MRKIINKKWFLGFLIVVFLLNASFVMGQCGPTPFPCIDANACGHQECNLAYNACDSAASSTCFSCVAACEGTGIGEIACIESCVGGYEGEVATCKTTAEAIQSFRTASGSFLSSVVPCGEMNSCMGGEILPASPALPD